MYMLKKIIIYGIKISNVYGYDIKYDIEDDYWKDFPNKLRSGLIDLSKVMNNEK